MATFCGVKDFAFDSIGELQKLAAYAPGSQVYCRIVVDNSGSDWPLTRKFGVEPQEAVPLLERAAELGLTSSGLTFHVGSQCLNPENWRAAMQTCAELWRVAAGRGIRLRVLNIGGGLPVQHLKPIPQLQDIGRLIESTVTQLFPPDVRVVIEPGRALVGDAGILVSSVIGVADRGGERWLHLDTGVFNGLMETIEGFSYEWRADSSGPNRPYTVAGPSCDSVDVMASDVELPELAPGDRVYVMNAGAYTLSYASHFNGFPPPSVHTLDGSPVLLALPDRANLHAS
jgi:ornithine decarboxylase